MIVATLTFCRFDWSLRSPVSVVSEEPAASSPCIDDLSPGDSPSISPPRSPVRCTSLWREVTMEENSSDGSDGDSEPSGPERLVCQLLSIALYRRPLILYTFSN